MEDLAALVRKHAVRNALDYGKAQAASIVGKVLAEAPDAKKDVKVLMAQINAVVADVNALPKAALEKEISKYAFVERKEDEKKLRLPDAVDGSVVTRFLPEPNGFLHLGHAKAGFLSFEAARAYGGTCILRFDDTNPEKEEQRFVDAIRDDLAWLGLSFSKETFTSDKMPAFYRYAEKMIADGTAYACACPKDDVQANRFAKRACAHREHAPADNRALWNQMTSGATDEGSMILRLKADVRAANTVMRDPTLFRVLKTPHYRQGSKYSCWPTYDFEVSISDSLDGVTHALRSKEYELRDELYYAILDAVGLRKPVVYDFARLDVKGTALSKRLLKPLIDAGKVTGWDDPRLPTLRGLARRGILPAAIRAFVLQMGLSKAESQPPLTALLVENKRLLEPTAPHYFFVPDPVRVNVEGGPGAARVRVGERVIQCGNAYFIPGADARVLKPGDVFRLKDHYNVRVRENAGHEITAEYAGTELVPGSKKLQWASALPGEFVDVEAWRVGALLNEDESFNEDSLTVLKGVAEKTVSGVAEGTVVQFERVGLARLDDAKTRRFILVE